MNLLTTLFSVIAVLISILAIFINGWVTFIPLLGIGFQYHRRWVQLGIALTAIGLSLTAYFINPSGGQLIVLLVVLALTPLSGFFYARKVLVAVDQPVHVPAEEAGWQDEELIIGYAADSSVACAWTVETLIPHHLVNDSIKEKPILVAW